MTAASKRHRPPNPPTWPEPPERDALRAYLGQEAAMLLSEYRRAKGKRGPGAGRRKVMIKEAALDLLRRADLPVSVVILFGVMLDAGAAGLLRGAPLWLDEIVDYEARAHNDGREVKNAELTDHVVMPANHMLEDRDHVMRGVRRMRRAKWYPALVLSRRIYLIDNPETV